MPLIKPHTFKPFGATDDYGDLISDTVYRIEVDGVTYLTDRFIIIRADLVEPLPTIMLTPLPEGDQGGIAKFIAQALAETVVPVPRRKLAPIYVNDFAEAGLHLLPAANLWLIQQPGGDTVGAIAPLRQEATGDEIGAVPGSLTVAHRITFNALKGWVEDRHTAWTVAAQIVADLKGKL